MNLALNNKENQNKERVIKLSLYIPYKPKYEKKNQLSSTVKKNNEPKKKK